MQVRKIRLGSLTIWNSVLVGSVIFAAFILPVFPLTWQKGLFQTVYSVIYISGIFSLNKRNRYILVLFFSTLFLEWISGVLDLQVLTAFSRGINVLFFIVIVLALIFQIASAREVTPGIILSSIAGYLLLGIIYAIFISFILQNDPGAYTIQQIPSSRMESGDASIPFYYGYVTLATLGYGDIVPLKPYTRSLATWIAISGQLYIAIIVALLVGKFAVKGKE